MKWKFIDRYSTSTTDSYKSGRFKFGDQKFSAMMIAVCVNSLFIFRKVTSIKINSHMSIYLILKSAAIIF